jgi:hypothetical protein
MEEYGPNQCFGLAKALLDQGFAVVIVSYYSKYGALANVKVDACFTYLEECINKKYFGNKVITVSHCIGMIFFLYLSIMLYEDQFAVEGSFEGTLSLQYMYLL